MQIKNKLYDSIIKKIKSFQIFTIAKLFPYVKPYLFRAVIVFLITIPIGSLDAAIAWSLKPFMDSVMISQNIKTAMYIPFLIVGFTFVQGILNYIDTYLNGWLGIKITNDIKRDLYIKLLTFEPAYFDKNLSGAIIMRYNNDAEMASSGLLGNLKTFFTRFFSSISLVCVLLYNSWLLGIIAVVILVCILLPMTQIRKRVKGISEGLISSGGIIYNNYNETFGGNRIIASYNLQNHRIERFNNTLNDMYNFTMKMTQLNGWIQPIMYMISSIGIALVIAVGSHLIISHQITSGNFVSFIAALIMLYTPIKSMGNTYTAAQMSVMAVDRIMEIFNTNPQITENPASVTLDKIEQGIKFENVWFEYVQDNPVLKDINLEIKVGEVFALVGNSGGGKTTLVGLIPRFYDIFKGQIKIDGIDIKNIKLESLREHIAVVFQDNFLFDGTIRQNILLGKSTATEEEINAAVKNAYLDDFVSTLEYGLDTQIGERGVLLSGGQKQRIAIARALIKNAPIVILDEATSALDNKSEVIVQKALDSLMENRTVLVIAHRLSTVQNASRIAVVNDGQIVEIGNHDQLMDINSGIYRNLYETQFKHQKSSNTNEQLIANR